MDRYKNFVKIEELKTLLRQGKNEEALEIADGMDPRKIKDNCDCMVLAEVFLNNGMLGKAKECYSIVYDRKKSRRVAMELVNISIRMKKVDEAVKYFDDYKKMAPNDYYNHIFKYKIDKLKGRALREQASDLEALKRQQFTDTWGYELAKIYHKMGEVDKCRQVCEDVIIWFGDGEAVEKAKTLKAYCTGDITLKELTAGKNKKDDEQSEALDSGSDNINDEINSDTEQVGENGFEGGMPVDSASQELESYEEEMTLEEEETEAEPGFTQEAEQSAEPGFTQEAEQSAEPEFAQEAEQSAEPEFAQEAEQNAEPEFVQEAEQTAEAENEQDAHGADAFILPDEMVNDTKEIISDTIGLDEGRYDEAEASAEKTSGSAVEEIIADEGQNGSDQADEDDDMKIYSARKEAVPLDVKYGAKTIRPAVQENDFFTDEIAKAVEEALKEESSELLEKEAVMDAADATKEWRKPEVSRAISEGEKEFEKRKSEKEDTEEEPKSEDNIEKDENNVSEPIEASEVSKASESGSSKISESSKADSKLMEAVERELGFVDSGRDSDDEENKQTKKSWREKWRERHQEKERKKIELKEQAEREELRRIRELEQEKQRFIESEKRKDKIKYLEHQKQISKLSNEKAKAEQEAEEREALKRSEAQKSEILDKETEDFINDFIVDTKGIEQEAGKREIKGETYTPKLLPCIEVPGNSIVNTYLAENGKNLEYYFGFFACQKNISNQILRCLEKLLDSEEDNMNYCIIGERGTGKKALVHGFAKFMSECGKLASSQIIWTGSEKINSTDLREKADKLKGRCLAIDRAGGLDDAGLDSVYDVVKKLGKKSMLVIADYRRNMVELFKRKEDFEDYFGPRISIPDFSLEDLYDYVDYKAGAAGFIFESEAYNMILRRTKGIMRATEEGALARTEKFIMKILDNAEQRNGEEYIRQTLEHEKHVRSNVIIIKDIPDSM